MNGLNRQRLLGFVAAGALAVLLGDRLVREPLVQSWKARSERLADLRQRVAKGTTLLDREASLRARWNTMLTNALPREISVAEGRLLQAFDRWSQESGVGIGGLRPQWKRSADNQTTLECRADVFGNLAGVTRFLYLLDHDPLGVRVETVELSTRDAQGQQLSLVLQVSGLMQPSSGPGS
jgi:hypothetical protein